MNIDPQAIESAITNRSRVVITLHYAGIPCDVDAVNRLAHKHDLIVVEDAAQAIFSRYRSENCGTLGTFGCISFHETKNLQCGEGGALIINDSRFRERAEILWQMGTNRTQFLRGEVKEYTWQDVGSSYSLSELHAAFLFAQLERGEEITKDRLRSWTEYARLLTPLAERGVLEVSANPADAVHNGHIFWIKTANRQEQTALLGFLREREIHGVFHFQPLHSAPAGKKYGRFVGKDRHTTDGASRLIRLPIHHRFQYAGAVSKAVLEFYGY
jgi:dTDP-4-amino-4,6-dideoxygalactose transaminase